MADVAVKKKNALKGKGGLVMLAVLALVGVLFLWDQKTPVRDPDSNPPVSDYVHATASDVTRIELKRGDGGFLLAKQGGKWAFEAPKRARAHSARVDEWLKAVLDATVSQKVEAKPENGAAYGLDKPAAELVLTTKGGTRTLQLGKGFQAGPGSPPTNFYAREAGDGRLFMVATTQVDDLQKKKLDDLRDKRLVELADEKSVQKIVIQRAAGPVEVQRRAEDKWELVQPFAAPADKMDVETLVSQLKTTEADAFAEDAAPDLAKYGLDQPRVTLQVTDKTGQHTVLFGKEAKDGKVYAARQGESEVTLVSKTAFESLDKKPADLRDRRLISLETDKITFVQLTNSHGTVKLQKAAGVTGEQWEIVDGPDPKQKKAKADIVQQVLNTITAPAFKHVEEGAKDLAKYGLDKPAVAVQVNAGAGKSQVFLLGKKSPEGNYYAKGSPDAVFMVMDYVFGDLNLKTDAFKETPKK